jgi:hypothetical protein
MFRTLNLGSSSGTHYLKSHTIYTNWYNCTFPLPLNERWVFKFERMVYEKLEDYLNRKR